MTIHIFQEMLGQICTKVYATEDELFFETPDKIFRFYHEQDCCESVTIESIVGDLNDLVGEPLWMAEEVSSNPPENFNPPQYESFTWTFYKFATTNGYVDVRWYGESSGYYSESVDFKVIDKITETG